MKCNKLEIFKKNIKQKIFVETMKVTKGNIRMKI